MKITAGGSNDFVNNHKDIKKIVENKNVSAVTDRIEISSVGKSLSNYSTDDNFGVSPEKLQSIRREVSSGTYNRDSKLVAQKLIDAMKGRTI